MPNCSDPNWLVSQSERKQAEEALLKAGALQNVIFNSALVWMVASYSLNIFPSCSFMRYHFPFILATACL